MRVWGKLLGAALGLRFGPAAVALGTLFGHVFDAGWLRVKISRGSEVFAHSLFELLGYMARIDGRVSDRETAFGEQLMDQLDLQDDARAGAVRCFNNGRSEKFDPHYTLKTFTTQFGLRSDMAEQLLACVVAAAYVEGELDQAERDAIRLISADLGFRSEELMRLIARYRPSNLTPIDDVAEAYKTLGVASSAGLDEIKQSYRRLISQYHPDKLQGAGIRGDALTGAQNKASAVRAAFERILAVRGQK
jgi:DnaJ like chaperone protein